MGGGRDPKICDDKHHTPHQNLFLNKILATTDQTQVFLFTLALCPPCCSSDFPDILWLLPWLRLAPRHPHGSRPSSPSDVIVNVTFSGQPSLPCLLKSLHPTQNDLVSFPPVFSYCLLSPSNIKHVYLLI